jgi:adenylyl-sulfate kinase
MEPSKPNHYPPKTFWLTGLSGAGKSTLAHLLSRELADWFCPNLLLDGDEVRKGLCRDLGFSDADRAENIRRVAEVASLLNRAGMCAIVALISPLREDRAVARSIVGSGAMLEVYVSTPLPVCESRDPKGLYRRARGGQLPNFTGIDAPYEAPTHPELTVDTERWPAPQCVAQMLALLSIP